MNPYAIAIRLEVRWINPHRYSVCLFCGFTPNVGITDIIAPHRTKLLLEGQLHALPLFFLQISCPVIPCSRYVQPGNSIIEPALKERNAYAGLFIEIMVHTYGRRITCFCLQIRVAIHAPCLVIQIISSRCLKHPTPGSIYLSIRIR